MFVITEYEQKRAIEYSDDIAAIFIESEEGPLYYKIFSDFIGKITCRKRSHLDERGLENREVMKKQMAKMLKEIK